MGEKYLLEQVRWRVSFLKKNSPAKEKTDAENQRQNGKNGIYTAAVRPNGIYGPGFVFLYL